MLILLVHFLVHVKSCFYQHGDAPARGQSSSSPCPFCRITSLAPHPQKESTSADGCALSAPSLPLGPVGSIIISSGVSPGLRGCFSPFRVAYRAVPGELRKRERGPLVLLLQLAGASSDLVEAGEAGGGGRHGGDGRHGSLPLLLGGALGI
uniref:Uncharacterized protein n=1 Tax=Arundo donax TaxID=35708 RepID=A0A0A9DCR1_ARUDO